MPCASWFGLSALSGLALAALAGNLCWAAHCRLRRMVLGTAADTLAARLEDLRQDTAGLHADDLQRCAELCATAQRLVEA